MHFDHFIVIGTSFHKLDASRRGKYSLNDDKLKGFYEDARDNKLTDLFCLSTCNRVEFYHIGDKHKLKEYLSSRLSIDGEDWNSSFYTKTGDQAIDHFFKVAAGLDSQILGDYEIVNQLKSAIHCGSEHGTVGTELRRISDFAFQASKAVRTETKISNGKYSFGYATARMLEKLKTAFKRKKVLVIGVGDIGSSVTKCIKDLYTDIAVTISNRTEEKADALAKELGVETLKFADIHDAISDYDCVISTVNNGGFFVDREHITSITHPLSLVDLSMPASINPEVALHNNVSYYNLDDVSTFFNTMNENRRSEIPVATEIIHRKIEELKEWFHVFLNREVIIRQRKLLENNDRLSLSVSEVEPKKVEKALFEVLRKNSSNDDMGCKMIEAINALVIAEK